MESVTEGQKGEERVGGERRGQPLDVALILRDDGLRAKKWQRKREEFKGGRDGEHIVFMAN